MYKFWGNISSKLYTCCLPLGEYLGYSKGAIYSDVECNTFICTIIRQHPVLLQGPTSAGKTSLIQYLAAVTGHRCLRINNHEHSDLQEYVGMYTASTNGQLIFQEGTYIILKTRNIL